MIDDNSFEANFLGITNNRVFFEEIFSLHEYIFYVVN